MRLSAASLLCVALSSACATTGAAPAVAPPPAAPAAAPPAAVDESFEVLMAGNLAGKMVVSRKTASVREVAFEFNDRGRGPKTATHVEFDEAGLPRVLDVTGVDYLKVPVAEHLHPVGSDNAQLGWSNGAEKGASATRGFYAPFYGPPALSADVARALLRAEGHTLPLLPAGSARIEKSGERTVEAAGAKMHLTRYDLIGFDFEPDPLWLDDDGELFAIASEWFSVVRAGWREVLPALIKDQDAAQSARLEAIAAATTRLPPAAGLALVNARIFDAEKKTTAPGTVVIVGERIVAAGPQAKVPAGAQVIDLGGKTVIPGLWDMHVHVSPLDGLLDVAAGVTSVRDLANDMDLVARLGKSWDAGKTVGPRMLRAGFIDGRGPFQGPTKVFADTDAEAHAAIAKYAAAGDVQIKVYSSLNPALMPGIVADAHARGMRVSGHVPKGMLASDFVEAGADEVQHINFILLQFLATRAEDTRTPLRFQRIADKAAGLDLHSREVSDFVKLLLAHHTVVDPTVTAIETMLLARRGEVSPALAHVANRLPVQVRRGTLGGGLQVPDGMDATYRASAAKLLEMIFLLWKAGVPIVAGTDDLAGFTLHHELERYVDAGIPAPDVLALATLGAARVMKRDAELGSIAAGKLADLVVIDGKPDVNIADVEHVTLVIKGGAVRESQALYDALGVSAWH